MVDYATNWTVNVTARNNAKSNIRAAVETAIPLFPFPVTCFDSDNGTEFINDELIDWLQQRDIEQTGSRPYRKKRPGHGRVAQQPRRQEIRVLLAL